MKIMLIIFSILLTNPALAERYCEVSLSHIYPRMNVSVNAEGKTYIYNYTIGNNSEALYSIRHIWIRSGTNSKVLTSAEKWNAVKGEISNNNSIHSPSNYIRWSSDLSSIQPSQQATGFSIESTQKPSLTIARLRGSASAEKFHFTKTPKDKKVSCPGVWEIGASTEEDFVRVMTVGPAMPNTISLTSYVRPEGKTNWSGSLNDPEEIFYGFSPLDKNNIEVLIISDDSNSIDEVDTNSISFGRGSAKPINTKKIKIENSNDFSIKINKNDVNGKSALLLIFKSTDVNPLCDLDRALFLTAKMKSGKELFSGVSIKNTECNQSNWIYEAKKILDSRPEEGH